MAYDLSRLAKPSRKGTIYGTIAGGVGVGKTTLAALFPSPVFLRFEDGTCSIVDDDGDEGMFSDVLELPMMTSSQDAFDAIEALATQDHDRKTLVIDTVTALNEIIEREILEKEGAITMNQACGGYGKAYDVSAAVHGKLSQWCYSLRETKSMNILYLAHTKIEKHNPPDRAEYTRYALALPEKSAVHYDNTVDLVAFVKHDFSLKSGTEDPKKKGVAKKALDSEGVFVTCHWTPSHVGKNRFKINEDIPFIYGINPFAEYLA